MSTMCVTTSVLIPGDSFSHPSTTTSRALICEVVSNQPLCLGLPRAGAHLSYVCHNTFGSYTRVRQQKVSGNVFARLHLSANLRNDRRMLGLIYFAQGIECLAVACVLATESRLPVWPCALNRSTCTHRLMKWACLCRVSYLIQSAKQTSQCHS